MIHASWSANRNLNSDQPFLIRIVEDEFTLEAPHAGDVVLVTKADGTVSEDVLGRLVFETRSKSSGTRGKLLWYFEQSPTPEAADIRRRSLRDVQPRSASSPSRTRPGALFPSTPLPRSPGVVSPWVSAPPLLPVCPADSLPASTHVRTALASSAM